jgi:ligand-binding sensor domain-containing protein
MQGIALMYDKPAGGQSQNRREMLPTAPGRTGKAELWVIAGPGLLAPGGLPMTDGGELSLWDWSISCISVKANAFLSFMVCTYY